MKIRKLAGLLFAGILLASLAAAAEWNIRFGHDDSDTSTYHYGLVRFKELVEERSGGRVSVEVFPSAQLGSSRDMIEGLQMGTLECAFAVTAVMSNFVPEYNVLDAPFIFRDYQHAYRVVDGPIGQELDAIWLKKQACRIMGYMDVGYRHIYSSRPIRTLDDLKGLKIRTMQSKLNMAVFNKLGAIATPMAGNEVFT
ncbi:MAG: TRAP transporter substrate-binding protein, partial [Planctomycetes bacterium]|nr:TRAP transporter substrate-binding protein [Planctomycetota bacterium]